MANSKGSKIAVAKAGSGDNLKNARVKSATAKPYNAFCVASFQDLWAMMIGGVLAAKRRPNSIAKGNVRKDKSMFR